MYIGAQTVLKYIAASAIMVSNIDIIDSKYEKSVPDQYQALLGKFHSETDSYWKFETVPDIFKQSSPQTDDSKFDYIKENFGITSNWTDITSKVNELNRNSVDNVVYKIVFLARHGQGYHNAAHEKYGNDAWDEYWSKLNGDGNWVWGPDPELTSLGKDQAIANAKEWKRQISQGAPTPTKMYASPFSRSIDTLVLTWQDILDLKQLRPLIVEKLRETEGVHTCDMRSSRTIISDKYAQLGFEIEDGFAEEDIYWKADYRETVQEHALRINKAFQEIFSENSHSNDVIGTTTHSGSIRATLLALGHRTFSVGTGGMIPVCVRAEKVDKEV